MIGADVTGALTRQEAKPAQTATCAPQAVSFRRVRPRPGVAGRLSFLYPCLESDGQRAAVRLSPGSRRIRLRYVRFELRNHVDDPECAGPGQSGPLTRLTGSTRFCAEMRAEEMNHTAIAVQGFSMFSFRSRDFHSVV